MLSKNILFIIDTSSQVEPLGIEYLSAILKKEGYIVDAYMYSTESSLFEFLDSYKPQIVCFSMTSGQHVKLLNIARQVKKWHMDMWKHPMKIVVGGSHPTYFPQVANEECIDYIVQGEADVILPNLLRDLFSGMVIKKKVYGNLVLPVDLDSIPFPDRSIIYQFKQYLSNPVRNVLTSRGCPYNCGYCVDGNTLITEASGNQEKVSDLVVGSKLIAFDDIKGQLGQTEVQEVFSREVNEHYKLNLVDGKKLKITKEHPILTKRGWVNVGDLRKDDEVLGLHCGVKKNCKQWRRKEMHFVKIQSLQRIIGGKLKVYNVRCDPIDTFIANNIVVHNCYNSVYRELYKGQKIVRYRSPRNIIDECKEVKNNYPTKMFFFADDEFSMNIERLVEIKELYVKEVKLPFHCQIRIDLLNEKRVKVLKEMGCYSLTFAIETGNESLRRTLLDRNITNNQIIEGCRRLRENKIKFRAENMIGLPNETFEQMMETLNMNIKVRPSYAWVSIYQPFPNTQLGEYCRSNNLLVGDIDDIKTLFTEDTILKFSPKEKQRLLNLQRLFSVIVEFPVLRLLISFLLSRNWTKFYTKLRDIWKKHCYWNRLFKCCKRRKV